MTNHVAPTAPPGLVPTEDEIEIIDRITAPRRAPQQTDRPLAHYLVQIAKFGGYLARVHNPPSGNIAMCADGPASPISKSVPA